MQFCCGESWRRCYVQLRMSWPSVIVGGARIRLREDSSRRAERVVLTEHYKAVIDNCSKYRISRISSLQFSVVSQ